MSRVECACGRFELLGDEMVRVRGIEHTPSRCDKVFDSSLCGQSAASSGGVVGAGGGRATITFKESEIRRHAAYYREGYSRGYDYGRKMERAGRELLEIKSRLKAEKPIDLDRMRYESRASSDKAATKALLEREPWHAGLDPDDP